MIPISKAAIFVEKGTKRQTPGEAIFTRLSLLTSAEAFVARATRALSQYYLWLQRTDRPW
jgi:hypothetical protein